MSSEKPYVLPKVWTWDKSNGGQFSNINRPVAGPTRDKDLPVGRHPLQLYSLATPNGVKVTVMLEELLALGHGGAEYDAWLIKINQGELFGSGFVAANPNSKIPALVDRSGPTPIRVFESGAILLYLAEKFGALLPVDAVQRLAPPRRADNAAAQLRAQTLRLLNVGLEKLRSIGRPSESPPNGVVPGGCRFAARLLAANGRSGHKIRRDVPLVWVSVTSSGTLEKTSEKEEHSVVDRWVARGVGMGRWGECGRTLLATSGCVRRCKGICAGP